MSDMAYSSKFVLTVLRDNQIQKEFADGIVPLPFGSEYALRLRNKHDRRALIKLFIDGEEVSGGGYIVPRKDKVDIFRPVDKDAAFKFVSLDSSDAADFGKSDNKDRKKGLIEARFYLEKEATPVPTHTTVHHYHYRYKNDPWTLSSNPFVASTTWTANNYVVGSSDPMGAQGCSGSKSKEETINDLKLNLLASNQPLLGMPVPETNITTSIHCSNSFVGSSSSMINIPDMVMPCMDTYSGCISSDVGDNDLSFMGSADSDADLEAGCTVEGSKTGQEFRNVRFYAEDDYVALKLTLQGFTVPEAPKTEFCIKCGTKKQEKANFCGSCGSRH